MTKRRLDNIKPVCPLLVILLCISAHGKDWHVSQKVLPGIDRGDQVRSIGDAVSRLNAGDTVIIHGGIYREQVIVDKNGTAAEPITIRAATGELVVVTGAEHLTDWRRDDGDPSVFWTDWPHEFISWNEHNTHPSDDYHRLIGRCEQVFVDGYPLGQVLERQKLSRGTFFVDLDARRLYVQDASNRDVGDKRVLTEASVNSTIWTCKGNHVRTKGIRFRSYGLYAHDNVIVGNGFAFSPGDWGANAGISISSSANCLIERNLLVGNKEGLSLREQKRSTPLIGGGSEPVWNRDLTVRNNVLAYNRDAQVWGWFDIDDERHWPKSMQEGLSSRQSKAHDDPTDGPPDGSQLKDLELIFENNIYRPGPGQGLFNWGVTWKRHRKYTDLDAVRRELAFEQTGRLADIAFRDFGKLDLRVPTESPAVEMRCYPQADVPRVKLGAYVR